MMQGEIRVKIETYTEAAGFLRNTQVELESNEAANSLMLGVCMRLSRHPERIRSAPCLKTVSDENGLVLAAMMTPPHKLIVYGSQGDLDGGAAILVEELITEGWSVPGVLGPSEIAKGISKRWKEVTRGEFDLERRQAVYELREVIHPVPECGMLRLATETDIELVARWWYGFHFEIFGEADREEARPAAEHGIEAGDIYLWEDQRPVSMAMKTRPTRNGLSVSMVYTPTDLRGRGYATACVGELSRLLLESGWKYCALFADLDNVAANRVYQTIGYKRTCDYDEYVFY